MAIDVDGAGVAQVNGTTEGQEYEAGRTGTSVDEDWYTIDFDTDYFGETPLFLAGLQTTNDTDTATLRYRNLTEDDVEVFAEEEQSDGVGNRLDLALCPVIDAPDWNECNRE